MKALLLLLTVSSLTFAFATFGVEVKTPINTYDHNPSCPRGHKRCPNGRCVKACTKSERINNYCEEQCGSCGNGYEIVYGKCAKKCRKGHERVDRKCIPIKRRRGDKKPPANLKSMTGGQFEQDNCPNSSLSLKNAPRKKGKGLLPTGKGRKGVAPVLTK